LGYAPTGGGAIRAFYNVNASLTLENCTISRNSSLMGWGAIHFNNTLILENSVVAFNKSGNQNGGILASSTEVSFCDFSGNDGPDIVGAPGGFGILTATNANGDSCDVYSNIFRDPLFADTTKSDYGITWVNWPQSDATRSPAIDAGDPASAQDPDGTTSDMGAYYFNWVRPLISLSAGLLDFGIVDISQSQDLPLSIRNSGTAALHLQSMINQQAVFSHNWNPADSTILPGDSLTLTVTFAPADTNLIVDTLLIEDNDRPLQVQLSGKGKIVIGIKDQNGLPKAYTLYPAYPNPFNPTATIKYDLPQTSQVILEIYNLLGEKVITLVSDRLPAGTYEYQWGASQFASGIYLYQLRANNYTKTKKFILIK